jgi:ubiquinone biosynthesis O-methyltransferase
VTTVTERSRKPPSAEVEPKSSIRDKKHLDELLDEALEQTFPASDPPAMLEPAHELAEAGKGNGQRMNRLEPTCALPDLGPEVYARWRASEIGATTERLEGQLILELVGDVNGCKVLDIGCGDGEFAVELAKRGAFVTGIDSSPAMIEAAKGRAMQHNADIAFRVAMAERLPFPAEQFDVVTAVTILCFVEDASPVFREIARVLRPGGRLVIGELGKWSTWAAGRRIRAWMGSPLWRRGRFRTANELRNLANQAGFGVESVRGAIYYPRWGLAARLLGGCDPILGRLTTIGAGFVALSATKPGGTA